MCKAKMSVIKVLLIGKDMEMKNMINLDLALTLMAYLHCWIRTRFPNPGTNIRPKNRYSNNERPRMRMFPVGTLSVEYH